MRRAQRNHPAYQVVRSTNEAESLFFMVWYFPMWDLLKFKWLWLLLVVLNLMALVSVDADVEFRVPPPRLVAVPCGASAKILQYESVLKTIRNKGM